MKLNATGREEEVGRFPDRYIASVKTVDGRLVRSSCEMRDAFRARFRDCFARCPDLPIWEFRSYLADFPALIREVLEGKEDDMEAALISLDQSKAFDRVDHRFLASVLETAGFKPEFRRWITMMYHNPQAVVQVNGRRLRVFAIERLVWQGCPLSPLLYVVALEPLLRRLRDERTSPSLRGVPFAGPLSARVSVLADDITVFVSRRLDIKAVKEAVVKYERIAGAKVNFDKSEGLRLSAWRGSNTLPGPFRSSDGPVSILGVWFGPDFQLERNWSEVQAKVNAQVGIWLSRRLSLKGRAEVCATYVFPLILYRLAVLPLPKARRLALQQSLSRLLWGGARPMVRRQVCIQCTRNGGLGMTDLESHWLAERLAYLGRSLTGDSVWRQKASRTFPRLQSDPKAEGRRRSLGEALFVRECRKALHNLLGSSDLSRPRKELYRELVPLLILLASGEAGRRRRSALTGIGCQD